MNRYIEQRTAKYYKSANNIVVLSNGQMWVNCDIAEVIKQAQSLGLNYKIVKGEEPKTEPKKTKNK